MIYKSTIYDCLQYRTPSRTSNSMVKLTPFEDAKLKSAHGYREVQTNLLHLFNSEGLIVRTSVAEHEKA